MRPDNVAILMGFRLLGGTLNDDVTDITVPNASIGANNFYFSTSAYSGDYYSQMMFRMLASETVCSPRFFEKFGVEEIRKTIAALLQRKDRNSTVIAERASDLGLGFKAEGLNPLEELDFDTPTILEAIEKGNIRFLIKNASDMNTLQQNGVGNLLAVSIRNMLGKKLEAVAVGYAQRLIAEREFDLNIEKFKNENVHTTKFSDATVFVVGFGDMGEPIAEEYLHSGFPVEQICIVDSNPDVLVRAGNLGFINLKTPEDLQKIKPEERPEMGILHWATSGKRSSQLTAENVQNFAKNILMPGALTSGGKAVFLTPFDPNNPTEDELQNCLAVRADEFDRIGMQYTVNGVFSDLCMSFNSSDRDTEMILVGSGSAINLMSEYLTDIHMILTAGVSLCAATYLLSLGSKDVGSKVHDVPLEYELPIIQQLFPEIDSLEKFRQLKDPYLELANWLRRRLQGLSLDPRAGE